MVVCDGESTYSTTPRHRNRHFWCKQKSSYFSFATVADSALRVEMEALEPEQEDAPARSLWYKPMAWLGVLRPLSQAESWSAPLWQTFFTTSIGFPVPLITSLLSRMSTRIPLCLFIYLVSPVVPKAPLPPYLPPDASNFLSGVAPDSAHTEFTRALGQV